MMKLFRKSKLFTASCLLVLIFLMSVISAGCGTSNGSEDESSYETMLEAVQAVIESTDKDLVFSNALYLYEDQESYDAKRPIYFIAMSDNELDGNELTTYSYIVKGTDVELTNTMVVIVPDAMIDIIGTADLQEQLDELANYEDLTHTVVDLAKESGRDLAEEAFLNDFSLAGVSLPQESIFTVSMLQMGEGGVGYVQAQYHSDTGEISVAESFDSGLSVDAQ